MAADQPRPFPTSYPVFQLPIWSIAGNGLAKFHQVAFGPDGELFAANYVGGWCKWMEFPCNPTVTILRFVFDAAGNAIPNRTINAGEGTHGLAFNSNGELLVARQDHNRYIDRHRFDPIAKKAIFTGSFTVPGLWAVTGLTFKAQGKLFAADIYASAVWRFLFDSSGKAICNGVACPSVLPSAQTAKRLWASICRVAFPDSSSAIMAKPYGLDGTAGFDPDRDPITCGWA